MDETKIIVLPSVLIDQIAAGEVVENPTSVVKELIDNAIDAGAKRITVEVEGAGLAVLRVIDDGKGMSPTDAPNALLRHATSKIRTQNDLSKISTMGFRGEALPSIASVSKLTLVTRRPEDDFGTEVSVKDGVVTAKPCAAPVGTTVTVLDLFYNTPARLKFQSSERSIMGQLNDLIGRFALAFPQLHLTMVAKRTLDYPPCSNIKDRAAQVYGAALGANLYEVHDERNGVEVFGVIGDPSVSRLNSSRIHLILNNRQIQDNVLRRAILNAYSVLLSAGQFPVAILSITLDPSEVDVNVHPRKTEVRFADIDLVARAVYHAVSKTVTKTPWLQQSKTSYSDEPPKLVQDGFGVRELFEFPGEQQTDLFSSELAQPSSHGLIESFSALRYKGQVARTVLVCEGKDSLVLIDQHAAHERVNFDRLWQAVENKQVAQEPLMFPEVLGLDPNEIAGLEKSKDLLLSLGLDLEFYSGDSVAIRSIPAIMRGKSAAALVRDCAQAATGSSGTTGIERLHLMVATIACHSSIRAGDALSDDEALALLKSMDSVKDFAGYCPHGRQAVVVHPISTVLRWFGR